MARQGSILNIVLWMATQCFVLRAMFSQIPSFVLLKQFQFAEANLGDAISKCDVEVLEFCGYGKLFIVQSRMSPDAFVQIAILAAYYKMYGSIVNTYESVLTKSFKLGRTEVI